MNANSSDKSSDKPSKGKGGWIFLLAGFVGALIVGWVFFPMALYSKQQQPINFNHAVHLNTDVTGIDGKDDEKCQYCHEFRKDGTYAGIPSLSKCTECHSDPESPLGDSPDEKKFLTEFVAKNQQVPWLIYSRQPDCVYFSHISHVKMAGIECKDCHGPFAENTVLPAYEENRISGYSRNIWGKNISGLKKNSWDSMKMDDCAKCHSEMGQDQNNACFVCHK